MIFIMCGQQITLAKKKKRKKFSKSKGLYLHFSLFLTNF